jgi:hypothetical protein
MNVTLPDSVREWIETRARATGRTVDEYVLAIIHQEQARQGDFEAILREQIAGEYGDDAVPEMIEKVRQGYEALMLEGLDSGPAEPMTADDWADIRREVRERREKQNRS